MEGDGLAGAVFRCIQEMDIDNRMSVSTNQETCDFPNLVLHFRNQVIELCALRGLYTCHLICVVCIVYSHH